MALKVKPQDVQALNAQQRKVWDELIVTDYRTVAQIIAGLQVRGIAMAADSVEYSARWLVDHGYAQQAGSQAVPTFRRAHLIEPQQAMRAVQGPRPALEVVPARQPAVDPLDALDGDLARAAQALERAREVILDLRTSQCDPTEVAALRETAAKFDQLQKLLGRP